VSDLPPITVTVPTALRITGLGRTSFYALIAAGRIHTVLIGRRRLVFYASLLELLTPAAADVHS
jgi:hypothetical protein